MIDKGLRELYESGVTHIRYPSGAVHKILPIIMGGRTIGYTTKRVETSDDAMARKIAALQKRIHDDREELNKLLLGG